MTTRDISLALQGSDDWGGPCAIGRESPAAATNVVLVGQFGAGNFGNDASLEAALLSLRRIAPGAHVRVACTEPERVATDFCVATLKLTRPPLANRWLRGANDMLGRAPYKLFGPIRVLSLLRDADVLVIPGTGVFDDFGDTPFGMPYVFFKWIAMARVSGTRVVFVSVGAGPAYKRLSRLFFRMSTRLANWRSYRDEISRNFVASLGTDTRIDQVFPDLVFGLPLPEPIERPEGANLVVGLGVMYYKGWTGQSKAIYDAYVDKLTDFTRAALARGYSVRLVIGQDNDEVAVDDILSMLIPLLSNSERQRLLYDPSRSVNEVIAQMLSTDVVVATRFHNVIAALRAGRPVISLGYLEKHDVLATDMGLDAYAGNVEEFTVSWLLERFDSLIENRHFLAAGVQAKVAAYIEDLNRQEELLAEVIHTRSHAGSRIYR